MTQVKKSIVSNNDVKPVLSITEGKKDQEQTPSIPVHKELTVLDLKTRATIIHLLSEKHTMLSTKRASLDTFTVKHDDENAVITVRDANGEEFKSSSPKTVKKLVEFWKDEFDEKIEEIENELRIQYAIS